MGSQWHAMRECGVREGLSYLSGRPRDGTGRHCRSHTVVLIARRVRFALDLVVTLRVCIDLTPSHELRSGRTRPIGSTAVCEELSGGNVRTMCRLVEGCRSWRGPREEADESRLIRNIGDSGVLVMLQVDAYRDEIKIVLNTFHCS